MKGALVDLFDRIEIFKRLESYTEVPSPNVITDIIVQTMVEGLNIFAIAEVITSEFVNVC